MGAQVKHKGVLHKMEKGAMSAPAEGKRGGVKSEDADVDIEKGSHAEASVSPFASFKVCNSHPWTFIHQRQRVFAASRHYDSESIAHLHLLFWGLLSLLLTLRT